MVRIICLLIGYAFGLFQTSYIYGRTKAEVQKKLKRKDDDSALKEKDEGNGNDVKLEEWVLDYLENYKKNEIKDEQPTVLI